MRWSEPSSDPRPVVDTIADMAWSQGGFLLENCHGVMHTVGRRYARRAGVTLANLMNYLPQSNDPGCPAGFAHGLVTAVGPDIDASDPRRAAAVCGDAGTRYQRYSCTHGMGHAFMRIYADELRPALGLCRALGPQAAPDCAQGAYHDYWFAAIGADDAEAAGWGRHRSAPALRRAAGAVRQTVLVPGLRRQPPGGRQDRVAGRSRRACATGSTASSARRASPRHP